MHVLIVGGAGMIGGHAALHLKSEGHQVTIAGRRRPESIPVLASFPFIKGDYVKEEFTKDHLSPFDAIVFAAGADVRHCPEGEDKDEYLLEANGVAVPRFAALARSAGVKTFVHIGSVYMHILPADVVESTAYIRSRKLAAEGVANLSNETFKATSLDPPIVVGTVPGMDIPFFQASVQYAEGKFPIPPSAPQGGLNFISVQSLSEAIDGALRNPSEVAGRTILIGDENLTYAQYFDKFFQEVGHKEGAVKAVDGDHPMLPRWSLYAGERTVTYETDPKDWKSLGEFRRNDVNRAIKEVVKQYRSS
ncbi:hypothetical protein NW762_003954 [Fusarium torreyae]|uniref:NAD-dependent epimerase/dehydratase domain-containing protein n=1 Tax=Fusarium torreyae TaxID=1237075 RepID=A0A9W8S7D7_9HYPO|nr:hypothetical protein NW762_003954 [Fusarium torreyae]